MFFIAITGLTDLKTTEKVHGTYFISEFWFQLWSSSHYPGKLEKSILAEPASHPKRAWTEQNHT